MILKTKLLWKIACRIHYKINIDLVYHKSLISKENNFIKQLNPYTAGIPSG